MPRLTERGLCALAAHRGAAAIEGVVPVLHAGSACGRRLHQVLSSCNGALGDGFLSGAALPCDNLHRPDIVAGGLSRLRALLEGTFEEMPGELYVLMGGCVAELVGDDLAALAREYRDAGHPVLAVSTPLGDRCVLDRSYLGWDGGLRLAEDVLEAMLRGRREDALEI